MSGWETVALRDVADVFDGPHATPAKTEEGPWYLSISSLHNGRFDFAESAHLSDADLPRWTKRVAPRPGDTVFSYETRLGEAAYWKHDVPAALGRRMGLLRPKPGKVEPRYLTYAYLGPQFQDVIREKTLHGATVNRIPVGEMPSWPLLLPSITQQREILSVLDAVDGLIENNRRRIQVLEEIARSIYREWFVKFHYPGHDAVPLGESALGLIPETWKVCTVEDLCSRIQAGVTPKRSEPAFWADPEIDWYKTGDLTDSVLIHSSEQISKAALEKGRVFKPETILMAIYGSPTVGRLGLVATTSSANQAALGLVADEAVASTEYLWFVLEGLRSHLNAIAQGAAQQNVSKEKVAAAKVILPSGSLVYEFTEIVRAPWRLSHILQRETNRLVALRDLLLPKLVTGQIHVSALDLDRVLEEAVA